MIGNASDQLWSGRDPSALPADVEHAQGSEVPDCSERTIGCLKTAAWLLDQTVGEGDDRGLCVAGSATYNPLREALNAVVKGRDPAEGGLPAIRDAWEKLQLAPLGTDDELGVRRRSVYVLASVMADRERSSERARQLLGYLRDQSGAEPPQAGQYIGSYASSKLADGSFVPSSAALNPVLTIGANAPHHLEHRSATGLMARNPARLGRVRRFAAR